MMGRGDWRKLEEQINKVLVPLGERVKALEERLEALEAPKGAPAKGGTSKATKEAA